MNVARMVGVDEWIINKAQELAIMMKVEIKDKRQRQVEDNLKHILD